jgi:hypothetical protein
MTPLLTELQMVGQVNAAVVHTPMQQWRARFTVLLIFATARHTK